MLTQRLTQIFIAHQFVIPLLLNDTNQVEQVFAAQTAGLIINEQNVLLTAV